MCILNFVYVTEWLKLAEGRIYWPSPFNAVFNVLVTRKLCNS
jgi:hypothetical protein